MTRASTIAVAVVPLVAYRLTPESAPPWLIGLIAASQAGAILWLAAWGLNSRVRRFAAAGMFMVVLAGVSLTGLQSHEIGVVAAGLCHALAYLSLLGWFSVSLLPNHEPVITILAQRVRRTMPDRVVRYTRHVTIAWCIFFLAQLIASAVLLATASEAVWSVFVGLLNVPLIAGMVLVEFGCRRLIFRREPHTGLGDTLLAMRHATTLSTRRR